MKLSEYSSHNFSRGRSRFIEALWIVIQALLISSWIPGSWHRCFLLWLFGAQIGHGVIIKPGVKVKFPWKLKIGAFSWIGEQVWIDNLADVYIGSNCCISQGAYLCTGSHDWSKDTFDLRILPITISESVWVCAFSKIAPGVHVGARAVLKMGSTAYYDLEADGIYQGCPAGLIGRRKSEQTACSIRLDKAS